MIAILALGPACAILGALLGRGLGTWLGFAGGLAVIIALGLGVWFAVGSLRTGALGFAAMTVWLVAGGVNARDGDGIALLENGDHVVGAHVADIAGWRDHARVTFADGNLRDDLAASATHRVRADGQRTYRYDRCAAAPIVPDGWTPAAPVRAWSLDDGARIQPWSEQVFHPTTPEGDCATALEKALAEHRLTSAPDAVYLERVDAYVDPHWFRMQGLAAALVPAIIWLLVGGVSAARRLRDAGPRRRRAPSDRDDSPDA